MIRKRFFYTVICAVLIVWVSALNLTGISVPTVYQDHSNWCWAASCQCVLDYYGSTPGQCTMANYIFSRSDCCGVSTFYWNHACNSGGTANNMQSVLNNWGTGASIDWDYLTWGEVYYETAILERPFIIGRNGHATVGSNAIMVGNNPPAFYIHVMDPWPGEGQGLYLIGYYQSGWVLTIKTW
jgi:hypothetical protein